MKYIRTLVAALLLTASAPALADCKIVLSLCKKMGIRSATSFYDGEAAANRDPNRCLQRAREYLAYCNSNQQVGAEFLINGVLTISAYVTPTSGELWTKSAGGHWIRVNSSY